MAEKLNDTSYLFGANAVFMEEMYSRYSENPASVDESWQRFFERFGDDAKQAVKATSGTSWAPKKPQIVGYRDPSEAIAKGVPAKDVAKSSDVTQACSDSIKALMLIRAYKVRGHLLADLDPLKITVRDYHPDLDPATYGFTEGDYNRKIFIGGEFGLDYATVTEILAVLRKTYCGHIGVEFMHIESLEQRDWISQKIENIQLEVEFSDNEKKAILEDLVQLETFEQFLHIKYPGTKRFSIEGGEAAVAAAEVVLDTAAALGVKEIVIGMPHRGRLNVLTKVMGKPYVAMLSEFQGNLAHPEAMKISGDVKYHLGTSSDREFPGGKKVHLSLTANPSHLEAVNPVVAGKVRAKQDQLNDTEHSQAMGILFHGDAAFAGQGVVAETLAFSDLKGYKTGGTMHIIVNNQIGFTTDPRSARSVPHPSEMGKIVQTPIFHVNGDDPEAVGKVAKIATEFRQRFHKDVILDIVCYRRYGHNEGDEPFFTQPVMYTKIKGHKTPMEVYAETLIAQGVITEDEFRSKVEFFRKFLDAELEASKTFTQNKADWLEGKWAGLEKPKEVGPKTIPVTGLKTAQLKKIGLSLAGKPEGFTLNSKLERLLEAKREMMETGKGIDWATAEALAFGSVLLEGTPVRLSGQDCKRGTFSHRHSVFFDQNDEREYVPLNHLADKQARFEVINSNLSEFAVLGFEYGYSLAEPNSLVLWEAQFGDFSNGAQVMIDQFIASGEIKWLRMSGLVLLLPHGYEGQGPEHSSARLERYLQLCAEDNMQVANCTTPANYFHILRRQIHRKYRKPLVLMTPKSLLRHRDAVSTLAEMADGTSFKRVIGETDKLLAVDKIRRVVLCSGKVYYDLLDARKKQEVKDVAIIRLEQFYPFPDKDLENELKQYKNAEVVWCQEEPENMGAWNFLDRRIEKVLQNISIKAKRPRYVGRIEAASPAAGYAKIHNQEQQALVAEALAQEETKATIVAKRAGVK